MLDRYWYGEVTRISPEAPVPIVKVERTDERLGGAGNVAANATALNANVKLLSILGVDDAGEVIERLLESAGIKAYIHRDSSIRTIIKLRVIGHSQQMIRIDFENSPSNQILQGKLADFQHLIMQSDLIVLSDYDKGSLANVADMILFSRKLAKPILVDSKSSNWDKYSGATLLTSNSFELMRVVGDWSSEEELTAKVMMLKEHLGLDALLLKRSEQGITLFSDHRYHEPTVAKDVFDISGAGDTVIATLAVMLAQGNTLIDSVRAANMAAGIVISKFGTSTVTHYELATALLG